MTIPSKNVQNFHTTPCTTSGKHFQPCIAIWFQVIRVHPSPPPPSSSETLYWDTLYIEGVSELMEQTLRVDKVHIKNFFLYSYSNLKSEMKSVDGKTENSVTKFVYHLLKKSFTIIHTLPVCDTSLYQPQCTPVTESTLPRFITVSVWMF